MCKKLIRGNGKGVRGRLEEPSDHNVILTLREREGKKVEWALRLLCLSKESSIKLLGSPGDTVDLRGDLSPRNELAFRIPIVVSLWPGVALRGLHAIVAVDLRA